MRGSSSRVGTLAGADLDMISAVRFVHRVVGLYTRIKLDVAERFAPIS